MLSQLTGSKGTHSWRFFRAGGFDQVRLDTGADLAALGQLDQKLWFALACPTKGLEFDAKTLEYIDTDKDGRVRAPELLAAVQWTLGLLKNSDDLVKESPELKLAAINDNTPEGRQVLAAARQILEHLGKKDAESVTAVDTADTAKVFAQAKFNGDGVVPAESTEDAALRALIADVIACCGAETDRSGKPGVSQAKVDQFFADAQAFSDWWAKAEADAAAVLPLGDATAAALAACRSLKTKVDDYFARCRLAAFDARAQAALNREEKDFIALAGKDLTIGSPEIANLPLAWVEANRPLPLKSGLNPAWAGTVAAFQASVVKPLLGDLDTLSEEQWGALQAKLGAFEAWQAAKAGVGVEKLGLKRVREVLAGKGKASLGALIAQDKALEKEFTAIGTVDKLVRYHQNLHRLCINFVSFEDFYDRGEPAIFQTGTLYLDQRSCGLCLPIEDAGKHAALAGLAGTYLAYCDCVRKGSGEKIQIVAAFTDGDSDNLMVGRNGIFYDRKGRDWDATITKIVDNPISLRQAFWSPYKKFVRLIEEQTAKRAAAADAAATAKLEKAAVATATVDKSVAATPAGPKKVDVGTVAALGVAFGAIGGFLTALTGHVMGVVALGPLAIIGAIIGVILLISGPSMILAFIKLRKRNLGPILDANGWAVNARAKINVPFGASLTAVAALPPGSQRNLVDPFAEKKSPWPKIIVLVFLVWIALYLLNNMGLIHKWTGFGKVRVEDRPAGATPAEAAVLSTNVTVPAPEK